MQTPERSDSYSRLCDTGKMMSSALMGAMERAVLIANDGTVLYMNPAAKKFLCKTSEKHVNDFLVCKDWRTVEHCKVVMNSGITTHNHRNIVVTKLNICPCCSEQYYVIYICSKYEKVREAVDHAFDPIFTLDENGVICTVNTSACEVFKYKEDEMIGQNISMIYGGGYAMHHDQYMKSYLNTGIKTIIGTKREVVARKSDGSEFPVEMGLQDISDDNTGKRYFCAFVKDLTFLKEHEAELQERKALAEGMINASYEPMIEIDCKGIIKIVNQAACSLFGYTREEIIGSNISIICGNEHSDKHDEYLKRYMETGVKHIIGRKRQVKARRKNGEEIEVELGIQEVILKEGKKAFCGYIRDLTQQKMDKQLLRKQKEIIHGKFFNKDVNENRSN